ncbi:MAG TPA: 30S ribosomal protein S4 [Actinomycetota bacterium]|nr:30S ribosomal protein S4 [Actinomycetota bacterium]
MLKVGPRHRICRRVGAAVCGRPNCPSGRRPYPPGQHGRGRRRLTEYQLRLQEKQKLRAIYGIGERQFRGYFERASRRKGVTGAELLRLLETRADAVALRLGFALSMRAARQLVSHGHVRVNGRRIDVPSATVRPGEKLELTDKGRNLISVREALEITPDPPPYLERDTDSLGGTLTRWPERTEIPLPVQVDERLIVEYYS